MKFDAQCGGDESDFVGQTCGSSDIDTTIRYVQCARANKHELADRSVSQTTEMPLDSLLHYFKNKQEYQFTQLTSQHGTEIQRLGVCSLL